MLLRYNKVLKVLAILLFSFELLVPALWHSDRDEINAEQKSTAYLHEQKQSIDFISHLIYEETTSEEREGKDDLDFLSYDYIEVFNELQKFQSVQIIECFSTERFDIQPSLFTLHRVLRI